MGFEARIGVGDTIVAMTPVQGLRNVALYLETADGDLGDVVAEWRGPDVDRAFETGELSPDALHRTAYLQARASGAFDRRERAFASATRHLETAMLREMRGDLASGHRPWEASEDADWILDAASAAARRLIHHEGGALADAPRGIRHDATEHLAETGISAEAAYRMGPAGESIRIDGLEAHLRATSVGDVEVRLPSGILTARLSNGHPRIFAPEPLEVDHAAVADAARAYLDANPDDVAAAAYSALVLRTRDMGRLAAELEAQASILHEEREGVAMQLADILGACEAGIGYDMDDIPPPPAP
jgi:hypothetical protein